MIISLESIQIASLKLTSRSTSTQRSSITRHFSKAAVANRWCCLVSTILIHICPRHDLDPGVIRQSSEYVQKRSGWFSKVLSTMASVCHHRSLCSQHHAAKPKRLVTFIRCNGLTQIITVDLHVMHRSACVNFSPPAPWHNNCTIPQEYAS